MAGLTEQRHWRPGKQPIPRIQKIAEKSYSQEITTVSLIREVVPGGGIIFGRISSAWRVLYPLQMYMSRENNSEAISNGRQT